MLQPTDGVQLYIELIDADTGDRDDLIDRFVVNITTFPTDVERENSMGIFDMAIVDMSFSATCRCDVHCPDACERETASDTPSSPLPINIIIQLVSSSIFLLLFLTTSAIVVSCMKKKINQVTQFSYIKYLRHSNNDMSSPSPSEIMVNADDYENEVPSNELRSPYMPADVAVAKFKKNIAYNSIKESEGCEPCPAYGSRDTYEPVDVIASAPNTVSGTPRWNSNN